MPTAIHPSLQIGIPAFIADREDLFQLYFVTVSPVAQVMTAPGKLQVLKPPLCTAAPASCMSLMLHLPLEMMMPCSPSCDCLLLV